MIWATVSSRSCFCWLYRASPSLTAKNIINLISVLTIWWCPCVESSFVLLEEGVCFDHCVLLAKLYYPLPCFIAYSKAKFACYCRCFLTSYFCIPVLWKGHLFWVLVLKGLVGLHRTVQFQLLQRYWLGHRLGLPWYWMVSLRNEQRSFCHFWDCIQVLHFRLFRCVFIGRTDAEAETPVLWPPHATSWLIGKDPDAGRDWGQEEKGTTEDEMAGWHHRLDGHEFE